jgi:hypothetical protein
MLGTQIYVVAWCQPGTERVNNVTLHKSREGANAAVESQVRLDTPADASVDFRNGCYAKSDGSVVAYLVLQRIQK